MFWQIVMRNKKTWGYDRKRKLAWWHYPHPGVGITKVPYINFSIRKNLNLAKVIPVKFFKSHSYLTGVTDYDNVLFLVIKSSLRILKQDERHITLLEYHSLISFMFSQIHLYKTHTQLGIFVSAFVEKFCLEPKPHKFTGSILLMKF